MSVPNSPLYEFGPYRLHPEEQQLLREGKSVALTPKAFDVLVALVERAGRLVEKEELLEAVWPDAVVDESAIAQNIFAVRRALGQRDGGPTYIETVPRRGYRFVPNVKVFEDHGEELFVRQHVRTTAPRERTLAVVPLTFLGAGDKAEGAYLGVAFADTFITRLGKVSTLTVRPTASVMHYAATNAIEAGRALNVEAVLDGKFRKSGEGLRITLQLIRVADGSLLWSESFDGQMADVFRLEDAISLKLTTVVIPALTGEHAAELEARGTTNRDAYATYWRGRYYWNQFLPQLLPKAVAEFQHAIALDPEFARAWVGIADAYNWSSIFGIVPTAECIVQSKAAAGRALEIDDTLGDAYTALGFVTAFYEWQFEEGERLLVRALELNPNDALAHEWLAGVLVGLGRIEEWRPVSRRMLELNPLSLRTRAMAAWQAYHAHSFAESIALARELVELNPNFPQAWIQLGNALEQTGEYEESIDALNRALTLHPDSGIALYQLCFALAGAGRHDDARAILAKFHDRTTVQGMKSYFTAMAHVALGEPEIALREFARALEERDPWMFWLAREPKLHGMRADARFRELEGRVVGRGSAS
jgi:DNA-binding winged helix-turn-helix (wHTH) protein/tetratricopeptide (TPR) repeat protein